MRFGQLESALSADLTDLRQPTAAVGATPRPYHASANGGLRHAPRRSVPSPQRFEGAKVSRILSAPVEAVVSHLLLIYGFSGGKNPLKMHLINNNHITITVLISSGFIVCQDVVFFVGMPYVKAKRSERVICAWRGVEFQPLSGSFNLAVF